MNQDQKSQLFRRTDGRGLMEFMNLVEMSDEQIAGLGKMVEAGYAGGEEVRVLVDLPGFSLTYAWLKKDYPLLLHSHDSDCLYYIVAGDLQMGRERLAAGDAFFVPADSAYQYRPGEEGVEVLEFRHSTHFTFRNLTKNTAFYDKAAKTVAGLHESWLNAKKPSEGTGPR